MDQKPPPKDAGVDTAVEAPHPESKGVGRRALLRGGAAAAPVLLALHSGPVAATGKMSCTVASSFVSLATFGSRNPGATTLQCSSKNAGHWHQASKNLAHRAALERPRWATRKLVNYLGASCSPHAQLGGNPNTYEVWQVMGLGDAPAEKGELGVLHHILGLALSIDSGGGTVNTGGVMNTPYLAGIWKTYRVNRRYVLPSSGINWSEDELIMWLKMLQYPMPLPSV